MWWKSVRECRKRKRFRLEGNRRRATRTDSTAEEGEHKRRVARYLGRDLEFEEPDDGAEYYNVNAEDDRFTDAAIVSYTCSQSV